MKSENWNERNDAHKRLLDHLSAITALQGTIPNNQSIGPVKAGEIGAVALVPFQAKTLILEGFVVGSEQVTGRFRAFDARWPHRPEISWHEGTWLRT
jgi:hypothetical protein